MVLNLFLVLSVRVSLSFIADFRGRELFELLESVLGLDVFAGALVAGFVGLSVAARVLVVFRSTVDSGATMERRFEDVPGVLVADFAAIEPLLTSDVSRLIPVGPVSFCKSRVLVLRLSTELRDALALCPKLDVGLEGVLGIGRRTAEDAGGLVGGLLRLLPAVARDVDEAVSLYAALGVDATVRFAVVGGRLGGIPFLGGVLWAV